MWADDRGLLTHTASASITLVRFKLFNGHEQDACASSGRITADCSLIPSKAMPPVTISEPFRLAIESKLLQTK